MGLLRVTSNEVKRLGQTVKTVERLPRNITDPNYRANHKNTATGNEEYTGPWAATEKDSTTVTIGALRDETGTDQRKDFAIVGLTTKEFDSSNDVTITNNGWVCLKLTKPSTVYVWEYVFLTDLDVQDNDTIYWPLAYVTFADSAIVSIQQVKTEYVNAPERFI